MFLEQLWGTKPDTTTVQLWRKSDAMSYFFVPLPNAADWIAANADGSDVYMAAGLSKQESNSAKRRANKKQVVGVAGVWADIDVNGGPEGKTGAASDIDEAMSLAESLLQPTLLVNSGYGLQAWWLYHEVWPFHTEEERDHAQRVVTGFQGALKNEARNRGYTIDSTFDLARLMRVPGSQNHKGMEGVEVSLLDDGGPRYDVAQLEEVGRDFQNQRASQIALISGEGVDIEVNLNAQPDLKKLYDLQEVLLDFRQAWDHIPSPKTKTWSTSEWEYSIVNYLIQAGWSDQEICDALVFHRQRWAPDETKQRPDRIALTIGKARATANYEQEHAEEEAEREAAGDQLIAISKDAGLDPNLAISLFSKHVGGPQIKELVQSSRDSDTARFHLSLADGTEVPLGKGDDFVNLRKFKVRFADATGHYPHALNLKKWEAIVHALYKSARVTEDLEDTRQARALDWIGAYCDKRTSTDKDRACEALDPFVHREHLHIPLTELHQYLRRQRGERLDSADVKVYLEAAGFKRQTINYVRVDGKRSSRSYFVAPYEGLGLDVL